MQSEKREPVREQNDRLERPAGEQSASEQSAGPEQPNRRGPFAYAAGWLGGAFDRDRLNKREAEERRNRHM